MFKNDPLVLSQLTAVCQMGEDSASNIERYLANPPHFQKMYNAWSRRRRSQSSSRALASLSLHSSRSVVRTRTRSAASAWPAASFFSHSDSVAAMEASASRAATLRLLLVVADQVLDHPVRGVGGLRAASTRRQLGVGGVGRSRHSRGCQVARASRPLAT